MNLASPFRGYRARRLVVHLGLAKTGTTILQDSLYACRDRLLADHGILYPSFGANHWHFQTMVAARPEDLIQTRREGISTREGAQALIERVRDSFETELNATRPETILISSEYFSSMTDDELVQMRDILAGYCDSLQPILYLRDPWSYATSRAQQLIRDGFVAGAVKPGYPTAQFDLVARFERLLGKTLILRPYLGGRAGRTDIIADFSGVLGIDPAILRAAPAPLANESIGYVRAAMIAELNRIWPQYDENRIFLASIPRDMVLSRILSLSIVDPPIGLSRNQAELITRTAAQGLDHVQRHFLGGATIYQDYFRLQEFNGLDRPISIDALTPAEAGPLGVALIAALGAPDGTDWRRLFGQWVMAEREKAAAAAPQPLPLAGR